MTSDWATNVDRLPLLEDVDVAVAIACCYAVGATDTNDGCYGVDVEVC